MLQPFMAEQCLPAEGKPLPGHDLLLLLAQEGFHRAAVFEGTLAPEHLRLGGILLAAETVLQPGEEPHRGRALAYPLGA